MNLWMVGDLEEVDTNADVDQEHDYRTTPGDRSLVKLLKEQVLRFTTAVLIVKK